MMMKEQVMSEYILKGYWRSSATWRVRIALHSKNLPFDYQPVHLVRDGGEQHKENFTQFSPLAQVPVFMCKDQNNNTQFMTQSMAIFDYLEALHPQPAIYPNDAWQRAKAIQYAEVVNAGIQPIQNLYVLNYVKNNYQEDHLAWGRHFIERGLQALENMCQHESSPFLVGDQPSIADFCLIPQLYNARRFKLDMTQFPRLCSVEQACEALPAFHKAHPDQQIDAQLS